MECPVCGNRIIDFNFNHGVNLGDSVRECELCGASWTIKGSEAIMITVASEPLGDSHEKDKN